MSFLEMIDVLNERLIREGHYPIALITIAGKASAVPAPCISTAGRTEPWHANTTCQLHMRAYKDGDTITIEPWRANSFPVIKDLMVDRSAFDRIIQAGGFISVNTGNAVGCQHVASRKRQGRRFFAAAVLHRLRRLRGRL